MALIRDEPLAFSPPEQNPQYFFYLLPIHILKIIHLFWGNSVLSQILHFPESQYL